MQVHATGEYPAAIIIDDDSTRRLWRHVEDFSDDSSATVSCADGIEREFGSLEELLHYENPTRAAVRTIEISGTSRQRSISLVIGRNYGAKAALSIRGEEQEVTAARARIMDSFAGMRAWYSPIATLDLWVVWFPIVSLFFLVILIMHPGDDPSRAERSFLEAVQVLGMLVLFFAPFCAAIFGISQLKTRFFPMVSVAIGQGARRHGIDEQVRWTVLVGVFVSLIGSAIYALIGGR